MTTNEKLSAILAFCIEENEKGNHLFFEFSGHCKLIEVKTYLGGWADKKVYTVLLHAYLDWPDLDTFNVSEWIEQTKGILHPSERG